MPQRLVDRPAEIGAEQLIAGLAPPPLFADARFDTYRPAPDQPTQAAALAQTRAFAAAIPAGAGSGTSAGRWRRRHRRESLGGIYLDGGFGVGKTHLLAAAWHAAPEPKAYATFVELTHLAGALGFGQLVERLSGLRLLAIDEFELDDPGDTVLVSTLLGKLTQAGVALAATSNTLPDRLGEERFATEDFLREIQTLAARFTAVRVDGPDYRHRGDPAAPAPLSEDEVRACASAADASLDGFDELLQRLAELHPSRYGALVDGLRVVGLLGVHTVDDESVALRLVVLADRLYDRGVRVRASGAPLDQLFAERMLAGGYRKKYRRAISRLTALARERGHEGGRRDRDEVGDEVGRGVVGDEVCDEVGDEVGRGDG